MIHKLDISFGEVAVCLNEEMLVKKKNSSDGSKHKDQDVGSTVDAVATKKPQTKQAALAKYTAILPEKVSELLPIIQDASFASFPPLIFPLEK